LNGARAEIARFREERADLERVNEEQRTRLIDLQAEHERLSERIAQLEVEEQEGRDGLNFLTALLVYLAQLQWGAQHLSQLILNHQR
jgi:hypothetical protein